MSDATDLKDRFAQVRLLTSKDTELEEMLAVGKVAAAQTLAEKLGIPVSRGVIDLQARRARN